MALLNSLDFVGRYIWRIEQQDINTAGLGQSGCETVDDGGARDVERYLKGENKGSINCCRIGMYPALRVTLFKFAVFWVARQAAMLISVVKQTVKDQKKGERFGSGDLHFPTDYPSTHDLGSLLEFELGMSISRRTRFCGWVRVGPVC